ncbi:ribulose-1,5-biphosphate synthetase [Polystyrenella longa]|uniref:Ribulose-1,5-biphosphate synthetase n=1 Tax=Polystyrenella longa TaxID=2528007 RepID=A0A518CPP4_9PLAN|nr:NAD(P)/FAD-dependent oxidoreductase [Polystyrenella longa]QDU81195.1 ribulose-1,5-biphosphate synthetase [Polystyrenella longa]
MKSLFDAVVIGSGPNGLAAAITLSRAGYRVCVFESSPTPGGGMRTAELMESGFRHDICSSIYPLVPVSPFFKELRADGATLDFIEPEIAVAHAFGSDRAIGIWRNLATTVSELGKDGPAYERLVTPFLNISDELFEGIFSPPLKPSQVLSLIRFGWRGAGSAEGLGRRWFKESSTRGMFAGMAAHAEQPPNRILTAAIGLMFCISAHATGWPIARGGAGMITDCLTERFRSLGGTIETGTSITTLSQLPPCRTVLFDTTPGQMLDMAGDSLPPFYHRKLRSFKHGPGICKVDWALDQPIPWNSDKCRRAGTVHIAASTSEIGKSEEKAWNNQLPEEPYLIVTQPSLFDSSRAPSGKHTGWAYCHVPFGRNEDMTAVIEKRIEDCASGFRDSIINRHTMTATDLHRYNQNYIGGDISGGAMTIRQIVARPVLKRCPYATPNPKLFICSASTPPGPGVHGMGGYNTAHAIMDRVLNS